MREGGRQEREAGGGRENWSKKLELAAPSTDSQTVREGDPCLSMLLLGRRCFALTHSRDEDDMREIERGKGRKRASEKKPFTEEPLKRQAGHHASTYHFPANLTRNSPPSLSIPNGARPSERDRIITLRIHPLRVVLPPSLLQVPHFTP